MEKTSKTGFQRYDLDVRVLEALPALGYKTATPVQHKVIPLILQRRNLLVEAATGTGKTAAYGLPLLSRVDPLKRSTQVLVLVPSRELARQVAEALRSFTANPKVRIEALYGGASLEDGERIIRTAPHILVAVPGRLKDVLIGGKFDRFWQDVRYLVLDEADKMLELGFQAGVDNLVSHVRNTVQVALFSATISKDVEDMVRERFSPLMTVRLSPREALKNIRFFNVPVEGGAHTTILGGLIQQQRLRQALIFCHKREEVFTVANYLRAAGRKAEAYHGLLDQVERDAILKRFRSGQVEFLVATDLAARGLDVQDLPAVINFHFPEDREVYLHRCGRTGRAGKKGAVYNFIRTVQERIYAQKFHDEWVLRLDLIEVKASAVKAPVPAARQVKLHLSRGKQDKVRAVDVAGFLTQAGGVSLDEVGTIAIYDQYSLADVPESCAQTLEAQEGLKIKGKTVKVTRYTLADAQQRAEAVRKSFMGVQDKQKLEREREKRVKKKEAAQQEKAERKQAALRKGAENKSRQKPAQAGARKAGNPGKPGKAGKPAGRKQGRGA